MGIHIVQKYKGGFKMNPKKKFLSEREYNDVIAKIKANLYYNNC